MIMDLIHMINLKTTISFYKYRQITPHFRSHGKLLLLLLSLTLLHSIVTISHRTNQCNCGISQLHENNKEKMNQEKRTV